MMDAVNCFVQANVFAWKGVEGAVFMTLYHIIVLIFNIITIGFSLATRDVPRSFLNLSFYAYFGCFALYSVVNIYGNIYYLTGAQPSCNESAWVLAWAYFFYSSSMTTLASIVVYHCHYLKRVHLPQIDVIRAQARKSFAIAQVTQCFLATIKY